MNDRILWAVILIGAAIVLFILEVFVPSAGMIGLLGAISLIGGIIALFWIDTTLGLIGTLVCIVAAPFFLAAMMKLWPHTFLFKAMVLGNESENDEDNTTAAQQRKTPDDATTSRKPNDNGLKVGDVGNSETPLRPVGICRIEGRRVECVADGQFITPGKPVQVVHIDGMQIKVRTVHP